MKVIVEFNEYRRMAVTVEAPSVEDVEIAWHNRYEDETGLVDNIENECVEVDGGILWDSVEFKEAP